MSEFVFSMRFTADGKIAKAEIVALGAELKKVTADTAGLTDGAVKLKGGLATASASGRELAGATGLATAAVKSGAVADADAARALELLSARQVTAGRTAMAMGGSYHHAGANVAQLGYQFNDIGVMMAAGQNPLLMAIQQGTQIGQVLGPMGAAGAVRALGAGFLTMLNPVNLVTIAVIAATGFFVQWMMSGSEATKAVEDHLKTLKDAVDAYAQAIKAANATDLSIGADYGLAVGHARALLNLQRDMARLDAERASAEAARQVAAAFGPTWAMVNGGKYPSNRGQAAEIQTANDTIGKMAGILGLDASSKAARASVVDLAKKLEALATVKGPTEQVAAFQNVRAAIDQATGGVGKMSTEAYALYATLVTAEQAALRLAAAEAVHPTQSRLPSAADVQNYLTAQHDAQINAENLLADLRAQAEAQRLISVYGAESSVVARARAAADREALTASEGYAAATATMKAEMLAAYDAKVRFAGVDIAGGIASARAEAAGLAGNLATAAANAWNVVNGILAATRAEAVKRADAQRQLDTMEFAFSPGGQALTNYGSRAPVLTAEQQALLGRNRPVTVTSSSDGGGAAAIASETNAVADLIKRLREEQDVLRETDPLRAEMLQYRNDLTVATAAERAEVEKLVTQNLKLKASEEAMDFLGRAGVDALKAIAQGGDAAASAIKNLENSLLDAAIQAFALGEGPLAGLFGISTPIWSLLGASATGGTGSLGLPMPFKNGGRAVRGFADGGLMAEAANMNAIPMANLGMQVGPGGPRDDAMTVKVSNGEYIVNAASTARYLPVLERINAGGSIPGFASGGMIPGSPRSPVPSDAGGSTSNVLHLNINLDGAKGDAAIEEMVIRSVQAGISHYDRNVMPVRAIQVVRQGGRVSG